MAAPEIEPLLLKLMFSVVLFRGLEREDLVLLLRGAAKAVFQPGQMVFEEGLAQDSVYVVVQGKFQVFKNMNGNEVHIASVLPGEHFGEIALLTDRPRSASVRALDNAVALQLSRDVIFADSRLAVSLLKNMASLMAEHLLEMNNEVLLLDVSRRQRANTAAALISPAA